MRPVNRNSLYWAAAGMFAVGLPGITAYGIEGRSVVLDNGVVGPGHLDIELGPFGSFGDWSPSWDDNFDPCPDAEGNDPQEATATFMTALFIFVDPSDGMGGGTHRGVLSDHSSILDTYHQDPARPNNLFPYIISKNTGNGGDTTTTSEVGISDVEGGGGDIDLHVAVTNAVGVGSTGPPPDNMCSATLTQRYVFTNVGSGKVTFLVNKHIDQDIIWCWGFGCSADIFSDRVGVDFAARCYPAVYAQSWQSPPPTLVSTFTRDPSLDPQVSAFYYYAAKRGIQPPDGNLDFNSGGDCPAFGFGTDYQIWDNYGVPRCWRNRVATVGTNVQGISPIDGGDAYMGTQLEITLEVGESYDVEYETIYGYRLIVPKTDCNQNGTQDDCESDNDCNGNGVPDDCESITDCNDDQVPDECQLQDNDCNANGIPDECDVASGQSPDNNGNGVPDECDPACATNADCADDNACSFDRCAQNVCTNAVSRYGDIAGSEGACGPDGDVGLLDIIAVLDGFGNVFADGCDSFNIDITSNSDACAGDGTIDLLDILAILDAFQGTTTCCPAP